jgi:rhamnosyl/mannosyltransferase
MRVLHFFKTFFPDTTGGIEETIHQIAMGGVARGIKADILALTREKSAPVIVEHGYAVHRAHRDFEIAATGFSVTALRRFAELAAQADIVHYHFPWPFMDIAHLVTRTGKPSVVTYHSDVVRQKILLSLYRPLMRRFLGSVDAIVATSPYYLETSSVLREYREKVSIIPIGLDRTSYPDAQQTLLSQWRARMGDRFFLFVGAFRYYKGLHILLEAARGAPYRIAIVGAGPIESELKRQAKRLELDNVNFLGSLPDPDKSALLALCAGVVFPSNLRSEAFGVSLLEGAMYGKPMISSEIGTGTSFINVSGQTGVVVPPDDPEALRRAMDQLWHNHYLAEQLGKAARMRYKRFFTASRMVDAYAALYNHLL